MHRDPAMGSRPASCVGAPGPRGRLGRRGLGAWRRGESPQTVIHARSESRVWGMFGGGGGRAPGLVWWCQAGMNGRSEVQVWWNCQLQRTHRYLSTSKCMCTVHGSHPHYHQTYLMGARVFTSFSRYAAKVERHCGTISSTRPRSQLANDGAGGPGASGHPGHGESTNVKIRRDGGVSVEGKVRQWITARRVPPSSRSWGARLEPSDGDWRLRPTGDGLQARDSIVPNAMDSSAAE